MQNGDRKAEIAAISGEAEGMICFNRVEALVLQCICLQLRHEPDTTSFLVLVDQQPASFTSDRTHRHFQLVSAVTTKRPQNVAGEALRMNTQQRRTSAQLAQDKGYGSIDPSHALASLFLKPDGLKHSPFGWKPSACNSSNNPGLGRSFHDYKWELQDIFLLFIESSGLSLSRNRSDNFWLSRCPPWFGLIMVIHD